MFLYFAASSSDFSGDIFIFLPLRGKFAVTFGFRKKFRNARNGFLPAYNAEALLTFEV
jgi:hypothetical protein